MQFRLFHASWFPALQYFSDYLQRGYYSFTNDDIPQYIQQVVNATLQEVILPRQVAPQLAGIMHLARRMDISLATAEATPML